MKTISINNFSGGMAEDVRTFATNECEVSTGFDLYSNPNKLIHYRDQLAEADGAKTIDEVEMTDVGMTTIVGTNYMVAFGYDTASTTLPASYIRTAYDFNGSWSQQAVGVASYSYCKGTYIQYLGISFVLSVNGTTYNLQKYTSAGTMTSVGTFTATAGVDVPRPYIHPDDKILYIVVGNTIAKLATDGTTFTSHTTILPTGYKATSVTHFGGYLAIAMTPTLVGDSILYLWGRDTSVNTLQGSVNMGISILQSIENIGGAVICVSRGDNNGAFQDKKIEFRAYVGGDVANLFKTITIPSTSTTNYNIVKARKDDKLYFAIGGEKAVYMVCKNKSGRYIVTQDRLISTGSAVTNVYSISFVGDVMYVSFLEGTYKLTATDRESAVPITSLSIYKTTINPGMSEGDRELEKKLIKVQVNYESSYAQGNTILKYTVDGTEGTISTKANAISTNQRIEGSAESTGIPFMTGTDFQFTVESNSANIKSIRYIYELLQNQ